MKFKPGIRELPLAAAIVLFVLALIPEGRFPSSALSVVVPRLGFLLAAVLLPTQVYLWYLEGGKRFRRRLVAGIVLGAVVLTAGKAVMRIGRGRVEILHTADNIWMDVNHPAAFSLSPDRKWLIYGRTPKASRFDVPGGSAVVARNLVTGQEQVVVPGGDEAHLFAGEDFLRNLDESVWSGDTLIVKNPRPGWLLDPAAGKLREGPWAQSYPVTGFGAKPRPATPDFPKPSGVIWDVAQDDSTVGGYLYYAEHGPWAGSHRLRRVTRDGRRATVRTLWSPWAEWFIVDVAVSPNGRWVALRAIRTPRYSPSYLFFVIPIIGDHGVDHLIVVDTSTGRSRDYGKSQRFHSLRWLPDSRHLAYLDDEIWGPARVKLLELPAKKADPDEPRVPRKPPAVKLERRTVRSISHTIAQAAPRTATVPPPEGWTPVRFGNVGFAFPGSRLDLAGADPVLALTRPVDGRAQMAYGVELRAPEPADFRQRYRRMPPVPGFALAALAGWATDQAAADPSRARVFLIPRGDGAWIRVVRAAGVTEDEEKDVTYPLLASFHVQETRGP